MATKAVEAKTKTNGKAAGGKKVKADKPVLVDENAKGDRTLPGMEIKVIPSIVKAVKQIETVTKPAFEQARDMLVRDKQTLSDVCHRNIEHFTRSEDSPGGPVKYVYQAGGVRVEMIQTDETIKAKLIDDEVGAKINI